LIKKIAPLIFQQVLYLFNLSLSTDSFPDKLKLTKVIPIFKKGDKYLPSNYRPISLLSIFSKLLEKIIYKRLYSYLQGNNILDRYQFGFRKHHRANHRFKFRAIGASSSGLRNSFAARTVGDCNQLPAVVVEQESPAAFKNQLDMP